MITIKEKNKRKLLLAMPLLFLPFLALGFYALGGGQGTVTEQTALAPGINTRLPDAKLKKEEPKDKLSLYRRVAQDSGAWKIGIPEAERETAAQKGSAFPVDPSSNTKPDDTERQINERLEAINKEINAPLKTTTSPSYKAIAPQERGNLNEDVDRLEKLMRAFEDGNPEQDPEMQQLEKVLDKLIVAQNPKGRVPEGDAVPDKTEEEKAFSAIPAIIDGNQRIAHGGVVRLRLEDSVTIKGIPISKGHLIYGLCAITNQRLNVRIDNIRLGNRIIPVDLSVFSMDGMIGVEAPSAELREAASGSTDDILQNIQLAGIDRSIELQAAEAGIDAARSLLTKKVKRIRVKLKDGMPLLLRNNEIITK